VSLQPFNTIGIGATFSPSLKTNSFEASRLVLAFKSKLILIYVFIFKEQVSDGNCYKLKDKLVHILTDLSIVKRPINICAIKNLNILQTHIVK